MNKQKLIELRCKAWGITEDEYYCNQCSDFSLEDMARAYKRGKNKGRAELEALIEKMKCCGNCQKLRGRFDSKTNINILYCSDTDMKQIEVGFQMCCCKWEIKEK